MLDYVELRKQLTEYGQEQLLQFWDELSTSEQHEFTKELMELNLPEVSGCIERAVALNKNTEGNNVNNLEEKMQPLPAEKLIYINETTKEVLDSYRLEGLRQVANGNVAVLLMAGGQGTRLGSSNPKGMYNIGLLSNKSLFCIQAERIRCLERLASELGNGEDNVNNGHITWYIMTSEHTRKPTQKYLEINNYFGLKSENVVLFEQGSMPCLSFDGKILLDQKSHVSRAPDGNGGIYAALRRQGILEDMQKRNIRYVHCHSVDNILIKVADPVFIGYCVKEEADCAAKVVEKTMPNEAVGVVALVDAKYQVVEYSELSTKNSEMRNNDGRLSFNAGNICNHLFSLEFLQMVCNKYENQLKLHVAKKKIPYVDNSGKRITPQTPNGIKIEKFVFDVFEFSKRFVAMMVARDEEFSALKNSDADGRDCPSTSRSDLFRLHKKYIEDAGGIVHGDECEISPLLTYAGENLETLVKGKSFTSPILLDVNSK